MTKKFWTEHDIMEFLEIEEHFLVDLEEEEIICPTCESGSSTKLFSSGDLEKLRLAKILVNDMGVNLAGVEVIIRMRQNMIRMRDQFDLILEDLAREMETHLKNR